MQKAEAQPAKVQSQPATKQGGGMAVKSPQSEQIAQLEAMMDSSPSMARLGNMAAMMSAAPVTNSNPARAAQLRMMDMVANAQQHALQRRVEMIRNSPEQLAAQKFSDDINNSPVMVQRRKKMESLFGVAQRVEDEEALQGKFAAETPAQLEQQPAVKPNNTGLPDNLKAGIENLSGMSMDGVKVHYNSSQPAQLNALAYAQGTDIHVAPGQEQHLPHEAWHVVQQAQGRVQPTMQMKEGVPVNDDKGLEAEADLMGAKALSLDANPLMVAQRVETVGWFGGSKIGIVQRTVSYDEDMANASGNYTTEMNETGTGDAVAAIYDHDLDGVTYGVYKTDVPSECQMVANKMSGAPEKIILPAMLDIEARGAPMSHGVTVEQQYKALARHELMHLRQALHNQGGSARMGTSAEAFSERELVTTIEELIGLVPVEKVVGEVEEGMAQQRRRKSNVLRTYVDSRIQYIVTSALAENQRGTVEGETEEVIASRVNYEAPTVIAELRDIVGHAITDNTIEVVGWDIFYDKLKEHHAALLQAGA